MPTNLYGENSHVIPALLRRFHEEKSNNDKEVIGRGKSCIGFYIDDIASASINVINLDETLRWKYRINIILLNVGTNGLQMLFEQSKQVLRI
jgi:GDP-L-fucose synthase